MEEDNNSCPRLRDELAEFKAEYKKAVQTVEKLKLIAGCGTRHLPDPIIFFDNKGVPCFLNQAFTDIFGWTLQDFEISGTHFVPDSSKAENLRQLELLEKEKTIRAFETRRVCKSGEVINVCMNAALNKDLEGKVIGRVEQYRDIREAKKFRDLLIESEEKYRSVMEAIADPVVVYDKQGRVTYFNPAFSRVFKWSLSERLNRKMDDFVPEESWPETKKMIQMVMDGQFFSGIETMRYDKHGNIIPVSISGSTYRDKNNKIIGSIISLQDVRQRKEAEKNIREKNRLEGALEMAGAVCHELSQPAMIIEGYADLFLMNMDNKNPMFEKMNKLKQQIDRISDLTQKLMKVTKYETREYSQGKIIMDIDRASDFGDS